MVDTEQKMIELFAKEMISKMSARRKRYKAFGWRDPEYKSVADLMLHLHQEVLEFHTAGSPKEKMEELVDIANIAFMLYDRIQIDNN